MFVERPEVLEQLMAELRTAVADGGRAVALTGASGAGRGAMLERIAQTATRRFRRLHVVVTDCRSADDEPSAWEIAARQLTFRHRIRRIILRIVPDWLEVVPVVGELVSAILMTGRTVLGTPDDQDTAQPGVETALGHVRELLRWGRDDPRLIALDEFDAAPPGDLAGAAALIRRLHETQTLLILAVRTGRDSVPPGVANLLLEAERLGRLTRIQIPPLSRTDVAAAAQETTGTAVPEPFVEWLVRRSRGLPGELWDGLGELVEAGRLREGRDGRWVWDGDPPPLAHDRALERLEGLDPEQKHLVGLAAATGATFPAAVLAELLELPELEVEERLVALEAVELVEFVGEAGEAEDPTSLYRLRPPLDAESVAEAVLGGERRKVAARAAASRRRLRLEEASSVAAAG